MWLHLSLIISPSLICSICYTNVQSIMYEANSDTSGISEIWKTHSVSRMDSCFQLHVTDERDLISQQEKEMYVKSTYE